MRKFRFKNEQEFKDCGEWGLDNYPICWSSNMIKYIGQDVPNKFTQNCIDKEKFYYDNWYFRPEEYIETVVDCKLNKNLLISVKEEQFKEVLKKIESLGGKIELDAFNYTPTWCYIGYHISNKYWCVARKHKDHYGDGSSVTFDEMSFTEFMGKPSLLKEFPIEGCVTINSFYDVDNKLSKYLQKTRPSASLKSSKDTFIAWNFGSYWYCQSSGKPHYTFTDIEHFLKKPSKSVDYPEYYEFTGGNNGGDFTAGKIYKIQNPKDLEHGENFIDDYGFKNGFAGINHEKFKPSTLEAWEAQENNVEYVKCIKGSNSDFHNKVGKIYSVISYDKKTELLRILGHHTTIQCINVDKPNKGNVTDYTRATKKEFDDQELGDVKIPEFVKVINKGEAYTTHPNAFDFGATNYDKHTNPKENVVYKVLKSLDLNGSICYVLEKNSKHYLVGKKGCVSASSADYYIDISESVRPFKKGDWVVITTKGASNVNVEMIALDGLCVSLSENDGDYYTMPGMTRSCNWSSKNRHYRHATDEEIKQALHKAAVYPLLIDEVFKEEFKVDDIVEGIDDDRYAITCTGWQGRVIQVDDLQLNLIDLKTGESYSVEAKYFKKIGIHIPEEKLSTESIIVKQKVKLLPLIAIKKRIII